MAFKNQIQPGVDNQLNSATGANAMGLRMPWGQAMFNLPRFQMPGTTANFGGGFGFPPQMGPGGPGEQASQQGGPGGQGAQIAPMGVRFSVQRQASSDPVANIVNDISNPLSGTNVNFTPQAAPPPTAPPKLKQQMVDGGQQMADMTAAFNSPQYPHPDAPSKFNEMAQISPFATRGSILNPFPDMGEQGYGTTSAYSSQGWPGGIGGLRQRMIRPSASGMPLTGFM